MNRLVLFLLASALGGILVCGNSAAASDGALLYSQNCAVCHGDDGDGGVGVPLNLPGFLAVASDRYLHRTIRLGRPGRVMPAFADLSESNVDAIVAYLRSLSKQPTPVYKDERLHGDAARGKVLFADHCTVCHGKHGEGGAGTGVTFSRPRQAPVMAPALNNPAFQWAASDGMLKATLLAGRKGTPMPSIKDLGLSEHDADDLVAYLRSMPAAAPRPTESAPPIIKFESSYDLEQTLANLKQSVVGHNFRIIREQKLDQGLAKPGEENPRAVILYFCDFGFLNEALAIDPRVGLFLPCRVTVIDTGHGVVVMSINPENLSHLFNNSELDRACSRMHQLYSDIMEEATL